MSASEIISELPKLSRAELEAVDAELHQLLDRPPARHWGDVLVELAGSVEGLPADYASNHDHYAHGTPKR